MNERGACWSGDTYKRVSAVSAKRESFEYRGSGAVRGSLWRQHVARSPARQCSARSPTAVLYRPALWALPAAGSHKDRISFLSSKYLL